MRNIRFLWSMIGCLILLLSVVTWSWYKEASSLKQVAAIGDVKITEADWLSSLKQKYGEQELNELINREVVFQEAKRLGIEADEKRIAHEMEKIKESFNNGQDPNQAVKQQLGSSLATVEEHVRYQLLLHEIATRDVAVSEEEMRTYFAKNRRDFEQPAKARALMIVVASKDEAEQVERELAEGSNFSTLAKERSIDTLTAANGGDMGWVSFDDKTLTDNQRELMFRQPLGKESSAIPLDNGYAIIQVTERKEAVKPTFEEVTAQIRQDIALSKVESLDDVLERLRQTVGVEIM